jgi:hypothetical protein
MHYLEKKSINYPKYFYTFLLIGLGGIPFFTTGYFWNLTIFIFSAISFFSKGYTIERKIYLYFSFLTIVLILQAVVFSFISITTTIGIYVSFLNAYFLIKLIDKDFFKYFVDIIYYIILISFIFFIPSLLFPDFEKFLLDNIAPIFQQESSRRGYSYNPNFIIYTLNTGITTPYTDYSMDIIGGRNPAAFHEAGGLGVYAVLAFFMNFIITKNIWNKKSLVLVLGILSTFSTATFIAFFITIISINIISKKKSYQFLFLPIFLVTFWFSFNTFDFLGRKLDENIQQSLNIGYYYYGPKTRFGSFMIDIYDLQKYPITGKGVNEQTRFEDFRGFNRDTHRNNGVSDLAVKFGFPFFLFYFYNIHLTFRRINEIYKINFKGFPLLALSIIVLLGFSQVIFMSVTFVALSFFHIILNKNESSMALPISDK